jgi:hypothetical protein
VSPTPRRRRARLWVCVYCSVFGADTDPDTDAETDAEDR